MNALKVVGLVLIVVGLLALVYGGFTYTQKTHEGHMGPFEFSVSENKTVNIPIWAGAGAVVVGAGVLFFGAKKP